MHVKLQFQKSESPNGGFHNRILGVSLLILLRGIVDSGPLPPGDGGGSEKIRRVLPVNSNRCKLNSTGFDAWSVF